MTTFLLGLLCGLMAAPVVLLLGAIALQARPRPERTITPTDLRNSRVIAMADHRHPHRPHTPGRGA